jgi:glycosyltransferase involved in cell wall biosynthesis
MRLVLVAYDFPPVPSPQSLRWAYLARELAKLGHEIHVLTPDLPGYGAGGLPGLPDNVKIHRVYPGPLSALLRGRRRTSGNASDNVGSTPEPLEAPTRRNHELYELNWKGRLLHRVGGALSPQNSQSALNWKGAFVERLKTLLSRFVFPDYRGEWLPWARRRLRELLADIQPDLVITSHEPACSLPLGLEAKGLGYRWVADLGDPVLAPYTPARWRNRAQALERQVCTLADLVTVTTVRTAQLLDERHGLPAGKCLVLTQGYDAEFVDNGVASPVGFDAQTLELLYTGSFYSFRRADDLIAAVAAVPGVRLSIGTILAPDYVRQAVSDHPDKFRLLGFLPHRTALALQRRSDVLVNLANADPVQVPGKVYEYLGARRALLHICDSESDATSDLIAITGAGWRVAPDRMAIAARLAEMKQLKLDGTLRGAPEGDEQISAHSWQRLARELSERMVRINERTDATAQRTRAGTFA